MEKVFRQKEEIERLKIEIEKNNKHKLLQDKAN